MRLYLVRHAVTAETGVVLSGREPGIGLSEDGRQAARATAEMLAHLRPRALVTSPLERCRETAEIVGGALHRTAVVDEAYIEADYGSWSGRRLSSLRRLKGWSALMAGASRFRFPQGETLDEVRIRAVGATEGLAGSLPAGAVAIVVSHADVIRVLLAHYLGMSLDLVHRLRVAPASVSVVELPSQGTPLVSVVNQQAPGAGA
jgi:probable phosphoglycerate mutase